MQSKLSNTQITNFYQCYCIIEAMLNDKEYIAGISILRYEQLIHNYQYLGKQLEDSLQHIMYLLPLNFTNEHSVLFNDLLPVGQPLVQVAYGTLLLNKN